VPSYIQQDVGECLHNEDEIDADLGHILVDPDGQRIITGLPAQGISDHRHQVENVILRLLRLEHP
jgi:hypothetical protein